jgi:diguanylate cyclase (GGDEF)-like protein/hemerythrin-like metal-binding protein/PAS domain S-box-containing protein
MKDNKANNGKTTNLELFPWNLNFDTGIAVIDEQHKKLVSLLNDLANRLTYQSDNSCLNSVFNELVNYAVYHFQTEEAIWHQFLPDSQLETEHKKKHSNFIIEVQKLKQEEENTSLEQVISDILSFLSHWLVCHILDSDKRMARIVQAIQAGMSLEQAKKCGNKQIDEVMMLLIESILSMYDNLSKRTLELAKEIAARRKYEVKQRLAASVFENTLDGICITDTQLNIIDANPVFCETSQYCYEEVIGKNLKLFKSGLEAEEVAVSLWDVLKKQGHWSGKISNRNKSGELSAEWLTLSAIKDEQGVISHHVGVFSNISHFIQQQHSLEHIAHHDALTDLPNRLLLYDRLELAIVHAQRTGLMLAVCYLDLDGFKPINDKLGHAAGDVVLKEIAQRLLSVVRNSDTVARLGGDEFVILFSDLAKEADCEILLFRVLQAIAKPIYIDNISCSVSASIGVTFFSQSVNTPELLLHYADQAMYQAKRKGKSQYCFYQPQKEQ